VERREEKDVAAASSEGVETSGTEIQYPEICANCVVEGNV
jgi:hypothetical protein